MEFVAERYHLIACYIFTECAAVGLDRKHAREQLFQRQRVRQHGTHISVALHSNERATIARLLRARNRSTTSYMRPAHHGAAAIP